MGKLELSQTLTKHMSRVWNIAWHPKDNVFASCSDDQTIRLWVKDGAKYANKVILTDGHKGAIREIAWSPCGNLLASASFDGVTSIWSKQSGEFECNTTLEGHDNEVKSVTWAINGHLLATCGRDKSVWVWEIDDEDEFACTSVINAHLQDVKKVIFHPEKEILASASYDNTIKLYREDPSDNDWICTATLSSHESTVWSISFDKSGQRLASCSDDKTVKIWEEYGPGNSAGVSTTDGESTWKCVCTLSGYHTRTIYDIDWCKESGLIATACGDDFIRIFKEDEGSDTNSPTFSLVASVRAHTDDVNSVKWNRSGDTLLSCSDDGDIKVWKYIPD